MDNRKRTAGSSSFRSLVFWSSSFSRQPARVLIVEALPPWWSEICKVLCDALDNFLSLACSLDGPCRIPLLSLYAISRQQECLLPFAQVRGNLARLHSCVEELRSIPGEGCIIGAARGSDLLHQTVLDSLQQFKQYMRHAGSSQACNNASVEVTVVTSQPGRSVVHQLETRLKDADLVSLRRLLVVQVCGAADSGQDTPSPEDTQAEDSLMLGTEVDLQQVENTVLAVETVFKSWLQEQGGDGEQLHLLLPSSSDNPIPVCVKCDTQERLISPALIPLTPSLGVKTESIRDFLPVFNSSSNQSPAPQKLRVIKVLRAEAVCESVLYGLPLLIRPTTCWKLDWDEMESNHSLFHALCHTLRSRDLFLLLQLEPDQRPPAGSSGVRSFYMLQPCPSLSLLLKPVVSRELLLPCSMPAAAQAPSPHAMQTIEGCLAQLDEEFVLNPVSLSSYLYQHLTNKGLVSQQRYPYRLQSSAAHKDWPQALEGPRNTVSRKQRQGRPVGSSSKVRATVAPMPSSTSPSSSSSSLLGPPPAKALRPALSFLSSRRAPAPTQQQEADDDDNSMTMQ
ncbi:meiosis 1 arrest protein [Cololabis saira]|uniref:meiosis 1 arrest protein n=1 Tax=Cololabis saira TaxID=129043 RepID=UPI002AD1EE60|nr:meiosis 1 arrest protein [Cololabis saira]